MWHCMLIRERKCLAPIPDTGLDSEFTLRLCGSFYFLGMLSDINLEGNLISPPKMEKLRRTEEYREKEKRWQNVDQL